ncbi:hypothetical protein DBZ36_00145 [Alginatibacterium sediminis]|uniref:Glycine zipper domain-containing protein n=1 Tax=Alginatibacterium sediminis TaxID=2164068 RepID=A0A420EN69_9ALTE|nr:hypothetical protein [Alginatibacterium sediminis]RKF22093.1 hypothetical protein DBZ36_00145 [Alginatibacterium sediminis]
MFKTPKHLLLPAVLTMFLSACSSTPEAEVDPNQGAKLGALGGGAIGLVLGAVTGDANLAMKGAMVGATTGAAAGAMSDLENAHENKRTDITAGAIAQPNTIVINGHEQLVPVQALNSIKGEWNLSVWALDDQGNSQQGDATALVTEVLSGQFDLGIANVSQDLKDFDTNAKATIVQTNLGEQQLKISSNGSEFESIYAGEFQPQMNRVNYHPLNSKQTKLARIEMRVISPDMWIIEAFQMSDEGEKLNQRYRFTRS